MAIVGVTRPLYDLVDAVSGDQNRLARGACEADLRFFEHPHRDPFRGKAAQAGLGVLTKEVQSAGTALPIDETFSLKLRSTLEPPCLNFPVLSMPALGSRIPVTLSLRTFPSQFTAFPGGYAHALKLWVMLRLGDGWMGLLRGALSDGAYDPHACCTSNLISSGPRVRRSPLTHEDEPLQSGSTTSVICRRFLKGSF